jgi:hypothetical protein
MIIIDEKKLEDLLGFELHPSTLKLIMTKLAECKEESVPAETMSDIYKVCNKRKTTREGHIDPLCECGNLNKMPDVISQAIIDYYKSKEAQEWVNASLGDASLTETERGQMETKAKFAELVEEASIELLKEEILLAKVNIDSFWKNEMKEVIKLQESSFKKLKQRINESNFTTQFKEKVPE